MWSQWERWCQARGVVPMPAAPAMICAYLTDRATGGVSVGTLDMDCGAISYMHRRRGLPDPVLSEGVSGSGSAVSSGPRPDAKHGRYRPRTSAGSWARSTEPPPTARATPRSSCSASPPHCAAPSYQPSTSAASQSCPTLGPEAVTVPDGVAGLPIGRTHVGRGRADGVPIRRDCDAVARRLVGRAAGVALRATSLGSR